MAGENSKSAEFVVSLVDKFTVSADQVARSVEGLNQHVKNSKDEFSKFGREFKESFEGLKEGAELLGEIGISMIGLRESLEAGARMTGVMTDIGQSARLTAEQLSEMGETIDDLGRKWGASNEGIANAAKNLSQDLLRTPEALKTVLDASLTFATSTTNNYQDQMKQLGDITQSVMPIMNGFGISAKGVGDAFDAIRATSDYSNIPVVTFMQNIGRAAEEAKQLGYNGVRGIKEIGTEVSLLARATGDPQQAFDQTFQMINRLMRPESMVGLLQIGLNMQEVMAAARSRGIDPFLASISVIKNRLTEMVGPNEQNQAIILTRLLGSRGLAGAFLAMADHMKDVKGLQDGIYKSHNLNAQDAKEKTDQWTYAWHRLAGSIDTLFVDVLGSHVGTALAPFVSAMDGAVKGITDFSKAQPALTQGIVDIGIAFTGTKLVQAGVGVLSLARSLGVLFSLAPPKWFLPLLALMETYELNKEASGGNNIPSLWNRLKSDWAKDFGGGGGNTGGRSSAGFGIRGRRALGGPVSGGSVYLVGENGPELFSPHMSGSIVPNGGAGSAVEAAIFRGVSEGTKSGIKEGLREFFLSGIGRLAGIGGGLGISPYSLAGAGIGGMSALGSQGIEQSARSMGRRFASGDDYSPRFSGSSPTRLGKVSGNTLSHARETYDFWKKAGLSDDMATSLVGNEMGEGTLGRGAATGHQGQWGLHWDVSHYSGGAVQWDPTRRNRILRETGIDVWSNQTSHQQQLEAERHELQTHYPDLWNKLQSGHMSIDEANWELVHRYEVSADQGHQAALRSGYGRQLVAKLGHGGETGGEHPLQTALNEIHGKPTIDDSHLDRALTKVRQLKSEVASLNGRGKDDAYWRQHWQVRHRLDSNFAGGTLKGE